MSLLFKNHAKVSFKIFKRYLSSIKEGSALPNIILFESSPTNKVNTNDLFKNKKGILFGVPGAFTPGCSKTHLPGYVQNYDQLKNKGYETIVCVSVNDPFVMDAWSKQQNATNKVKCLADTNGEFTKAIGMQKELTVLGGLRSKRYALLVDNNVVKKIFEEPDGTGLTCSLVDNVLQHL